MLKLNSQSNNNNFFNLLFKFNGKGKERSRNNYITLNSKKLFFSFRKEEEEEVEGLQEEGQRRRKRNKLVLIMLPGNPGIPSFYDKFLDKVHSDFPAMDIITPSYTENVLTLSQLETQLISFFDLLTFNYPEQTEFILMGHSLGSYLSSRICKARFNANIKHVYSLFPAMRHIAQTPRGKVVGPLTTFIPKYILTAAIFLLNVLFPTTLLKWIAYRITGHPSHIVDAITENLDGSLSCMHLGQHEMRDILDLDYEVMEMFKDRWTMFFGVDDGWCPEDHIDEFRELGVKNHIVDDSGMNHAFVSHSSEAMGSIVASWLHRDFKDAL